MSGIRGHPGLKYEVRLLFEEKCHCPIVDHRVMVAEDILPEDGTDGINPPHRQLLVGEGHIDREDAVGPEWQPFESQTNIRQRIDGDGGTSRPDRGSPGLSGVGHGDPFGSTIAQIHDRLGRPGVEDDVEWAAVEVAGERQVADWGSRHWEAAEAVVGEQLGDCRRVVHAECATFSSLDRRSVCVIMSNMKTATIREVQHHLAEVLSCVARGEEVAVLRRGKMVAKLVPPDPRAPAAPDFLARAKAVWGKAPGGSSLSDTVSASRGER